MVGTEIKIRRAWKGLTLKELSEMSGVPAGRISEYENGHRTPSIDTLVSLAESIGPFEIGGSVFPTILELPWSIQTNPEDFSGAATLTLVRTTTMPTTPSLSLTVCEEHEVRYLPEFRRLEMTPESVMWNLEGHFEVRLEPVEIPLTMDLADAVTEWASWDTWHPKTQLRPDTHNLAPLKDRHDPDLMGYSAIMQWIKGRP